MKIFVFDFDDTLFPTSFYRNKYIPKNDKNLEEIKNNIEKFLEKTKLYGMVFIITNAEKKWVELCLDNFLNGVKYENVEIFSTVDHGINYVKEQNLWKTEAFKITLSNYFKDNDSHQLISFGDNINDRDASLYIKNTFSNVIVKNILFKSFPTIDTLITEQKLVLHILDYIIMYSDHMDMKIAFYQTNSSLPINQKSSNEVSNEKDFLEYNKGESEGDLTSNLFSGINSVISESELQSPIELEKFSDSVFGDGDSDGDGDILK